jgi:hypothetical protein
MKIACSSGYTITEDAPPANGYIQIMKHGDSTLGFILPTYTNGKDPISGLTPGCPITSWEVSTVSGSIVSYSSL